MVHNRLLAGHMYLYKILIWKGTITEKEEFGAVFSYKM